LLFKIGHLGRPARITLWRFSGHLVESPVRQLHDYAVDA
jgi:hypothetical protein